MAFMDILRKIGLFRSGKKKATYKNAKERPIEFQDNGIFDADKDLISLKGKRKNLQ